VDELRGAAREAWLYGLPLIEMGAQRHASARANSLNTFGHRRSLSGPRNRGVTAPNNDTLFSSAFLDLRQGPVEVTLPATGDRYFSLALMDMFTNNFAILGTRTTGREGGSFVLTGPDQALVATGIRSPTPWVWALARTLVEGEADLPAARAVQDQLVIAAPPAGSLAAHPNRNAAWPQYFSALQALLDENAPPEVDGPFFSRIATLGLGPGKPFGASDFNEAQRAFIEDGVQEARLAAPAGFSQTIVDGWAYPDPSLGDFGTDYLFRATVALTGLAALPPAEAMYMQAVDEAGHEVLHIEGIQQLHFPAGGLPPVGAFWSLSMYEVTPEGQYFLTENPLARYSIGDRTPGLTFNADGSLDIWISRTDPGEARRANWLPAPAAGPYRLSLRAYLPKPPLLEGAYRLPPLTPA
jgi:hypothetical protein